MAARRHNNRRHRRRLTVDVDAFILAANVGPPGRLVSGGVDRREVDFTSGSPRICRWCVRRQPIRLWWADFRPWSRARSAVTSAHAPLGEFAKILDGVIPVVAYRAWRWWLTTTIALWRSSC